MIAFNTTALERWERLHRRLALRVQRQFGRRPSYLARVFERQARGVVHLHIVLGAGTDADEATARAYMRLLHELAPDYGFGFSDSTIRLMDPRTAASYCVKHLAETVADPSSPRQIVWIARSLLERTGCTVRALRQRRFEYATNNASPGPGSS